jgi:hypothetical protein
MFGGVYLLRSCVSTLLIRFRSSTCVSWLRRSGLKLQAEAYRAQLSSSWARIIFAMMATGYTVA